MKKEERNNKQGKIKYNKYSTSKSGFFKNSKN